MFGILRRRHSFLTMEVAAIVGLVLFIVSEILPFTPLKGNGIAEQILKTAREIFPHKSHTDLK